MELPAPSPKVTTGEPAADQSLPKAVPELALLERPFSSYRPTEWDDFAVASNASFLGSWKVINYRRFLGRIKLFDFLLRDGSRVPEKVGQCAVRVGKDQARFLDRIYLKPERLDLCGQCFTLVARHLGAKTYHYGSSWNDEDRLAIAAVPTFVTESVLDRHFHVDVIDLRDWGNFAAYRRTISENIRRDYRKAHNAAVKVNTRFGLAAFRDLAVLVILRGHMVRRNKIRFSPLADWLLHAVKLIILGKTAFITTARVNGTCYAAFFGTQFGANLYYISGGTRKNHLGAGSYLFLNLIENWFSLHPTGRILMGECRGDHITHTWGAFLYRRKLRVRSVPGLEFELKLLMPLGRKLIEAPKRRVFRPARSKPEIGCQNEPPASVLHWK
jgi:hypothetical protein